MNAARAYKELPGGYVQNPVVVMKSNRLSLRDKLVFCATANIWRGFETPRVSDYRMSDMTGLTLSDVSAAKNTLVNLGLINLTMPRTDCHGVGTATFSINPLAANEFFQCEMFDVENVRRDSLAEMSKSRVLADKDDPYYANKKKRNK